jgi:lauroyl/myristoyl acyltransferase
MQKPSIDNRSETARRTEKPGEFSHYYLNFLALFGRERRVEDIAELARQAVSSRDRHIDRFGRQIADLHDFYRTRHGGKDGRADEDPAPLLGGWEACDLSKVRSEHGGLLIALFHYGHHRQVFYDLAVTGVPFLAPVAKQSYFECLQIGRVSTRRFEHAFQLIEVESPRVGRDLLKGMRSGRVGLIYVDGNMGPDGHKLEEGGLDVDFFGRRIRVKEGIARLAHGLGVPVLPLFVEARNNEERVAFEPLLYPMAKARASASELESSRQRMMQTLYQHLEDRVRRSPSLWEFAFCLHRWIVQRERQALRPVLSHDLPERLTVHPAEVALFERDGRQYWVHVGLQLAFQLPVWARGLYGFLSARPREANETEKWLEREGPGAGRARALLVELHARDLVIAADFKG